MAHIWLIRMSAEWIYRSDQLQSMVNSNPALLRMPLECRLVELCCVCVFILAKNIYIFTSTCCRTWKRFISLRMVAQYLATIITMSHCYADASHNTLVACNQKKRTKDALCEINCEVQHAQICGQVLFCCSVLCALRTDLT